MPAYKVPVLDGSDKIKPADLPIDMPGGVAGKDAVDAALDAKADASALAGLASEQYVSDAIADAGGTGGGGNTSALPYLLTIGGDPAVLRPTGAGAYHHVETDGWVNWNNKEDGDRHSASPPPAPVLEPIVFEGADAVLTWSAVPGVARYDVVDSDSGNVVLAVPVASLDDSAAPTATVVDAAGTLAVRAVPAPLIPGEDPVLEGYASALSNTRTADLDTTPPADVFLNVVPSDTGYTVSWENPGDADLALVELYESDDDQATPDQDRLGFFDADPSPFAEITETIGAMVPGDVVWTYLRLSDDANPANVRLTTPVRVEVSPPPPAKIPATAAVPFSAASNYLAWTDTTQRVEISRQVTSTFEDDPANVVATLDQRTAGQRSVYVDDGTGDGPLGAPTTGQAVYYFFVPIDGAGQHGTPDRTSPVTAYDAPPVDTDGVELSYVLDTSVMAEGDNTRVAGFVVSGENGRADVALTDDTTGLVGEDVAGNAHLRATGNSIDIKFNTVGRTKVVEFLCYATDSFPTKVSITDGSTKYNVGVRLRDSGRLESGAATNDGTVRKNKGVGTGWIRMEITENGDGTALVVIKQWRGADGWVEIARDTGTEHAGNQVVFATGFSPHPALTFPIRFYEVA